MKVFILGHSKSGRTITALELSQKIEYHYIPISDYHKSSFRSQRFVEKEHEFEKELFDYSTNRLKLNPLIVSNYINEIISLVNKPNYIIDGIVNPNDFVHLFNYNEDVVVFLNRIDTSSDVKDYEQVALNVIRDYCLFLSVSNLLTKKQWLEYNFKIPGEEIEFVKQLGRHNTITITKSLNKAIEHLKGELCNLQLKK